MGGRSAARRYAGLFEERVVGKAAKRGVSAPKLLSRREPGAFCRGYPFKPFFASLRGQGSPSSGKKTEVLQGEGGCPSLPSRDVYGILVRRPWKMVLTHSPPEPLLRRAVPGATSSPGTRRTFASDQTAGNSEGTGLWKGRKCEACHNEIFEDWKFKEGYKTIKQPWCEGSRV